MSATAPPGDMPGLVLEVAYANESLAELQREVIRSPFMTMISLGMPSGAPATYLSLYDLHHHALQTSVRRLL
jgi:hypothetical protein